MANRPTYEPVDLDVLAKSAEILGWQSASFAAISDAKQREDAGEIPAAVQARASKNASASLLVFDARNPPDFFPKNLREAYIKAAAEHDAKALALEVGDAAPRITH